jgi:ubiquinone/menaquinone biosynthesis C-methylase UbiE
MIPLDQPNHYLPTLDALAQRYLNASELQEYHLLSGQEKKDQLQSLLEKPIAHFSVINDLYFRARWGEALQRIHPDPHLALLEVATGDADMIPQTMERTHPKGRYFTANMNASLNRSFAQKTAALNLDIHLFADDASAIESYIGPDSVDVIAFQHALNDVVQAILCAQQGIDTIDSDWMETLPIMIAILRVETAKNTLEQHTRQPLLDLMQTLRRVLKKGGIIAMNHYQFQLDLDWGYPPALFENFVPMVRQWLKDCPGYHEIQLNGFHPQWWLFLQKA